MAAGGGASGRVEDGGDPLQGHPPAAPFEPEAGAVQVQPAGLEHPPDPFGAAVYPELAEGREPQRFRAGDPHRRGLPGFGFGAQLERRGSFAGLELREPRPLALADTRTELEKLASACAALTLAHSNTSWLTSPRQASPRLPSGLTGLSGARPVFQALNSLMNTDLRPGQRRRLLLGRDAVGGFRAALIQIRFHPGQVMVEREPGRSRMPQQHLVLVPVDIERELERDLADQPRTRCEHEHSTARCSTTPLREPAMPLIVPEGSDKTTNSVGLVNRFRGRGHGGDTWLTPRNRAGGKTRTHGA